MSFLASGIGIHEGSIFRESIKSSNEDERRTGLKSLVQGALEDTNLGLGKVSVSGIDFARGEARVSIANCFEAMENGTSPEPNCMFTSGFLAGVFAEVLDKTVRADEVKCISKGEPLCEFHISPAVEGGGSENLDASNQEGTQGPGVDSPASEGTTDKAVEPPKAPDAADAVLPDFDSAVEKASRIAKRKQRFWDRLFK